MAVAADVSQATIGNMLMGRVPSKSIAEKVARAAGIDVQTMLVACGYEQSVDTVERLEVMLRKSWPDLEQSDLDIIKGIVSKYIQEEENNGK